MSVLKIKDENGNWIGIPTIRGEKGDPGDQVEHAARHAKGGTDEITPSSIGAAEERHTHSCSDVGAAASNHTHTPESIGAASTSHTHDDLYYTEREVNEMLSEKAPAYSYGTDDLTAGTSELTTGKLHFVYE